MTQVCCPAGVLVRAHAFACLPKLRDLVTLFFRVCLQKRKVRVEGLKSCKFDEHVSFVVIFLRQKA